VVGRRDALGADQCAQHHLALVAPAARGLGIGDLGRARIAGRLVHRVLPLLRDGVVDLLHACTQRGCPLHAPSSCLDAAQQFERLRDGRVVAPVQQLPQFERTVGCGLGTVEVAGRIQDLPERVQPARQLGVVGRCRRIEDQDRPPRGSLAPGRLPAGHPGGGQLVQRQRDERIAGRLLPLPHFERALQVGDGAFVVPGGAARDAQHPQRVRDLERALRPGERLARCQRLLQQGLGAHRLVQHGVHHALPVLQLGQEGHVFLGRRGQQRGGPRVEPLGLVGAAIARAQPGQGREQRGQRAGRRCRQVLGDRQRAPQQRLRQPGLTRVQVQLAELPETHRLPRMERRQRLGRQVDQPTAHVGGLADLAGHDVGLEGLVQTLPIDALRRGLRQRRARAQRQHAEGCHPQRQAVARPVARSTLRVSLPMREVRRPGAVTA
jgi:hypothetical protein